MVNQIIAWDGCGSDNGNWGAIPDFLTVQEAARWAIDYQRGGMAVIVDTRVCRDGWVIDAEVPREMLERAQAIRQEITKHPKP